jgi:protein-tyrosine phosphatase
MKILMVCLGNICRSPLAEGIMRRKIDEYGLSWQVDSAGTGSWHIGERPHRDSVAIARNNGIDITGQTARQFRAADLETFDFILAMDDQNHSDILAHDPGGTYSNKVKKLLDYHPERKGQNVPDPYFEGGFDRVFDMIHEACTLFVKEHT